MRFLKVLQAKYTLPIEAAALLTALLAPVT
jgi:hypothetical protein